MIDFKHAFVVLTGNDPFPWQRELYDRFAAGRLPPSCNLPTGLGKTSVIPIWLIALANAPTEVPRRLVYVVNRRTVVDQTTNEVEKIRANLPKVGNFPEHVRTLAISTLRGQFADNREWSADPSRAAVICGTVDMIGSRLLFSGYGVGFKAKPLHAGFLGQDVLVVHDEAHLEPAFQKLIVDIEKEQRDRERTHDLPWKKLRVMELSATSRGTDAFSLSDADRADPEVKKRIEATKRLVFHSIDNEKDQLADKLVELALVHNNSQRAILVFVRSVEDVSKVVAKLPKGHFQQLTGTLRGLERDRMADPRKTDGCPIFARFLKRPKEDAPESERWKIEPKAGTVYLVCTSAGEVGVNISADHLVCDLSPFDSMAQRFGRVNRFGLYPDTHIDIVHPTSHPSGHLYAGTLAPHTRIDIVHPTSFKDDDLDIRRRRTLTLLQSLNGDGSPAALGELKLEDRLAAFSPQPVILPTSDILFDAWALTTIREKLPGRPPVEEYLHGKSEWEPPQTQVAWREEVWELRQEFEDDREHKLFQKFAADLLEDYPLKTHELLKERSDRVFNALKKLAAAPETPVWVLDDDDAVTVTTLGQLTDGDKEALDSKTVLLPPQAGALGKGLLDASVKHDPARTDYDMADEWHDNTGPLRLRKWNDDMRPAKMKLVREIVFRNSDDEDAPPMKIWYWFERLAGVDADTKSTKEYHLQPHLDDAKDAAEKFVSKIVQETDLRSAIVLAAQFHDLGKDRKRWQNGIGNEAYPVHKWAKSGNRRTTTALIVSPRIRVATRCVGSRRIQETQGQTPVAGPGDASDSCAPRACSPALPRW